MSLINFNDDDSGLAFRDVVLGFAGILMAITIILLIILKIEDATSSTIETTTRGDVRIEIVWENVDTDVDLWVQSPMDKLPVGYSHKSDNIMNLFRDDLGKANDITDMNYEVAVSRGIPQGEWTVNLHWYANREQNLTRISVKVLITIRKIDKNGNLRSTLTVLNGVYVLDRVGQEITVVRFTTDKDGEIVRGSINSVPKLLRGRR